MSADDRLDYPQASPEVDASDRGAADGVLGEKLDYPQAVPQLADDVARLSGDEKVEYPQAWPES